MKILVLGGNRFYGLHLVESLLEAGHEITVAPRGLTTESLEGKIRRVQVVRTDPESLRKHLGKENFDVVCDNLSLCSEDVRSVFTSLRAARYVTVSSGAVYEPHAGLLEGEFDPYHYPLHWSKRNAVPYEEGKRRMEAALFQTGPVPCTAVRFPYLIGEDDHTRRMLFFAEHIYKGIPMRIENPDISLSFIHSKDAGAFLAWLATEEWTGPVNACNAGAITLREIISYIESKCRKRAILSPKGDPAPYDGASDFTLDTSLASAWGYEFPPLDAALQSLLNAHLKELRNARRLQ